MRPRNINMKAVFLDRDGVINEYPGEGKYLTNWENFRFLPGVKQALKKLSDNGFEFFIISNQAGVSKGIFSQEELDRITKNMVCELQKENIVLSGVYYCTHEQEDNCCCRKPKTGMIDSAVQQFKRKNNDLNLSKSFFVGDTIRDIETGKSAGLKTILVYSGKEKLENKNTWLTHPDYTAIDLREAAQIIIEQTAK